MTENRAEHLKFVTLRILEINDVSDTYVNWFKSKDVVLYSDNQYRSFSLFEQKKYVNNCLKNNDVDLYGIFFKHHHIGNITVSGLNSIHKRAEISYVIGDISYWNRGFASLAVAQIIKISKKKYKLNKLYAGISAKNIGSIKVLEKNGFLLEGVKKNHLYYNNIFSDQLDYGLLL
jgi:ribosomal-protein-alanine N-acetyltransferase